MKTLIKNNLLALLGLAFSLPTLQLHAQNAIWQNIGTDWNTAANWNATGVPGAANNALFNVPVTQNPNLSAAGTASRLTTAGDSTAVGSFTLSSSSSSVALTLIASGTDANSAINYSDNTGGTLTISAPLILGNTSNFNQTFRVANATSTVNISGVISSSDTQGLIKGGAGTLILNSATTNTYTGGTEVAAGTLRGSTTSIRGNVLNNGSLVFDQTTAGTYSGNISGTGSLTKLSTSELTLSGNNSYTGGTFITLGTVTSGANGAIGTGPLTFNNSSTARLNLNGTTNTISGITISGAGTRVIQNEGADATSAGELIFDIASGTNTIAAGTIVRNGSSAATTWGTLALTKNGAGTLDLANTNTYTGATTVNAGTLLINGSTAAGSAVTVANNATLGGNGTINGNITVEDGGILAPGSSIGTINVGQLSLDSGANLLFELTSNATAGTTYDQINGTSLILAGGTVNLTLNGVGTQSIALNDSFTLFTGSVTNFSGTTFNIINNTDWTGGWQISQGSLIVTAIPEPSSALLLLAGLGALALRRRLR
jgi:autotransporter-associated beta strand protein